MFSIDYKPSGIVIRRTLFPSTGQTAVFDLWRVTNLSPIPVAFEINDFYQSILHHGAEMDYLVETQIHGAKVILNQHESKFFWIEHSARPSDSTATNFNVAEEFRPPSTVSWTGMPEGITSVVLLTPVSMFTLPSRSGCRQNRA